MTSDERIQVDHDSQQKREVVKERKAVREEMDMDVKRKVPLASQKPGAGDSIPHGGWKTGSGKLNLNLSRQSGFH